MMTRLAAMLLLTIAVPVTAQTIPQWITLEGAPEAGGRFDDVKFRSPELGWVVSVSGEIWHTSDGGATWGLQRLAEQENYRSVAFSTDRVGFVGAIFPTDQSPGVLFETRDGGVTWDDATWRIIGPRPSGICGMWATSEFSMYGVGAFHGDPILIRTFNGGDDWYATRMDGLAGALIDVHFVSEQVGFLTGGSGGALDGNAVVLRTADGGNTWTKVHETAHSEGVSGEWGWKITFPTPLVGYVSVEYASSGVTPPAKVLKTVDGGLTWSELLIPGSTQSAGLQAIGFISEDVGWASGRGTTSVTTDGGATWTLLRDWSPDMPGGQLDGAVNRIYPVNDTLAYAIGRRIYRLTTSGVSVASEPAPAVPRAFEVGPAYPNPTEGPVKLPLALDHPTTVRLWVIDLLGRVLHDTPPRELAAGRHELTWDGRDLAGRPVAPGPYLVLFDIGESKEMKNVVVVR